MPSGNFSGIEIFTRFVKIKDLPPPTLAGLFFCLASVEGAGLLFLPATIQPHTSVYSAFCAVHAELYTTSAAKQLTGLYRGFSCNLPCFAAVVWRVYPAISHRLRHAGAHHSAVAFPAHTRYQRHAGRCTGQHIRPIIIMYIRVQECASVIAPCQTVQHITDHASPAGSAPAACGLLASAAPGGAHAGTRQDSQSGGRRGTIDGCRRISFRAFAR